MFYGRKKKTTDVAKDGSSKSVEHSEEQSAFKGAGTGTMKAVAAGQAQVSFAPQPCGDDYFIGQFSERLTGIR